MVYFNPKDDVLSNEENLVKPSVSAHPASPGLDVLALGKNVLAMETDITSLASPWQHNGHTEHTAKASRLKLETRKGSKTKLQPGFEHHTERQKETALSE